MDTSYLNGHPSRNRYPEWTPNLHSDPSQGDSTVPRRPLDLNRKAAVETRGGRERERVVSVMTRAKRVVGIYYVVLNCEH